MLNLDPPVQAALIAATVGFMSGIVGAYFKHFLDKRALRDRLETEYQYAERKKLRELIGRSHGRMLEAAERMDHRLVNLQENESKGWLNMNGKYGHPDASYYFTSTLYRTVSLMAVVRLFEAEAIFIDARIAREGELVFAKFAKALEWALTDADLFKDLGYDTFRQTDHIFSDTLRLLCDSCAIDGKVISIEEFRERLTSADGQRHLMPLLTFFDGLCATENRLRWDRVIVLHLLLMAFINTFGYDMQKSSTQQFLRIARSARHQKVIENCVKRIPELGLEKEAADIVAAMRLLTGDSGTQQVNT